MILENDFIRITLNPQQGARLSALHDKTAVLDLLSHSDAWAGNAGLEGLFASQPFDVLVSRQNDAGSVIVLSAVSAVGSLKLTKAFALRKGERGFSLTETVENLGAQEREILWGQRVAFSAPFIDAACEIVATPVSYFDALEDPILRMRWPLLADGTDLSRARVILPGEARTVYLADFEDGLCRVVNPARGLAVEVRWDASLFSYCWMDERAGALSLAPFTGLPNAVEEGHGTVALAPGGKVEAKLVLTIAHI